MKNRVYIDDRYIQWLDKRFGLQFSQEFGIVPNNSQLVELGLINLESQISGQEYDIKVLKNGKIICTWEKI